MDITVGAKLAWTLTARRELTYGPRRFFQGQIRGITHVPSLMEGNKTCFPASVFRKRRDRARYLHSGSSSDFAARSSNTFSPPSPCFSDLPRKVESYNLAATSAFPASARGRAASGRHPVKGLVTDLACRMRGGPVACTGMPPLLRQSTTKSMWPAPCSATMPRMPDLPHQARRFGHRENRVRSEILFPVRCRAPDHPGLYSKRRHLGLTPAGRRPPPPPCRGPSRALEWRATGLARKDAPGAGNHKEQAGDGIAMGCL